jgi:WD40 repeat protein
MRRPRVTPLKHLVAAPLFGVLIRRRIARRRERDAENGDSGAAWSLCETLAGELDESVRSIARQALSSLKNEDTVDSVCRYLLLHDDRELRLIAAEGGYQSQDKGVRALLLFLAGNSNTRCTDGGIPDPTRFRQGFTAAGMQTRRRILAEAEKSGRLGPVVRGLTGDPGDPVIPVLTSEEWEILAGALSSSSMYRDLWRLVFIAPPGVSISILHHLTGAGWIPEGDERSLFFDLIRNMPESWKYPSGTEEAGETGIVSRTGISCITLSPGGSDLIIGGHDGSIQFFRLRQGEKTGTAEAHNGSVTALAVSPDGRILASGGADAQVQLWDLVSGGTMLRTCSGHAGPITCLLFGDDGSTLVSGSSDGMIRIWATGTGLSRAIGRGHTAGIRCLAITPGQDTLITGSLDCSIRLWDLPSGRPGPILTGHQHPVRCLSLSPDGGTLFSAGDQGPFRCWNIPGGDLIRTSRDLPKNGTCTILVPGIARGIRGFEDGRFTICCLEGEDTIRAGGAYRPGIRTLAVSPDESLLATGGGDGTIRCWDLPGGTLRLSLKGHHSFVRWLGFSPAGDLLVSLGWDETVRVWSLPGGEPATRIRYQPRVTRVFTASPGGDAIVTGDSEGKIHLFSIPNGRETGVIESFSPGVTALALNPDGSVAACAGTDRSLRLWRLRERNLITTLDGHGGAIHALAFSPDGSVLAGGGWDEKIHLWDARRGSRTGFLGGHSSQITALVFSADGLILASGSNDGTVRIWDPIRQRALRTLRCGTSVVTALAITPDQTLLASGDRKGRVILWRLADGTDEKCLEAHTGPVSSIGISPDSTLLATGGEDGSCRLWSLPDGFAVGMHGEHTGKITGVVFPSGRRRLMYGTSHGLIRRIRLPFTGPVAFAVPDDLKNLDNQPGEEEAPEIRRRKQYLRILFRGKFRFDIGYADPAFSREEFDIEIVEPFDAITSREDRSFQALTAHSPMNPRSPDLTCPDRCRGVPVPAVNVPETPLPVTRFASGPEKVHHPIGTRVAEERRKTDDRRLTRGYRPGGMVQ